MKLTIDCVLDEEDLAYLKNIITAQSSYKNIDDLAGQIFENAIINDKFDLAQPIDSQLRARILNNRSGQKPMVGKSHPLTLNIQSELISKYPNNFMFLRDSLALHSFWTIDCILNYVFTQIMYGFDKIITIPVGDYEKLEFESTKTDYLLSNLRDENFI